MPLPPEDRVREQQDERDRSLGLEPDPHDEVACELELADRIAEHASLPPADALAREAARQRLGHTRSPYEQPHEPRPLTVAAGDRVRHHDPSDARSGRVVGAPDHDGLVEIDFGRAGHTVVAIDELEPDTT